MRSLTGRRIGSAKARRELRRDRPDGVGVEKLDEPRVMDGEHRRAGRGLAPASCRRPRALRVDQDRAGSRPSAAAPLAGYDDHRGSLRRRRPCPEHGDRNPGGVLRPPGCPSGGQLDEDRLARQILAVQRGVGLEVNLDESPRSSTSKSPGLGQGDVVRAELDRRIALDDLEREACRVPARRSPSSRSGNSRRRRPARARPCGTGRRCTRRRGRALSTGCLALRAGPRRGTKGAL